MIHLTLGRVELDRGKNGGFQDHCQLFRPCDLTTIPYFYAGGAQDAGFTDLPLITSRNGHSYRLITEMKEGYSAPLSVVARRLLLLGHTDEYCRDEFEVLRAMGYCNHLFEFDELKEMLATADVSAARFHNGLGSENFVDFFARYIAAPRGEATTSRLLDIGRDDDDLIGLSAYSIIRLLAANPTAQDIPITWQFADVADNGWAPRSSFVAPLRQSSRFLIVTEGSSDVYILKQALALLTPDLADFFDFVDMQENYPFTGTGNLYNFVRGLISIKIQNNIIVVFDNDAEGLFNCERCLSLNRQANMKITRLPDLDRFKRFRTIGPTGEHFADINGKAAAIECYLDLGLQPIVRWTSYDERRDCYQGGIVGKRELQKTFLAQNKVDPSYDYSGLEAILAMLIAECVSITEAEAQAVLAAERQDL